MAPAKVRVPVSFTDSRRTRVVGRADTRLAIREVVPWPGQAKAYIGLA